MLIVRIYEVFPLVCPQCGSELKIVAFLTEADPIQRILTQENGDRSREKGQEQEESGPELRNFSFEITGLRYKLNKMDGVYRSSHMN